MPPRSAKKAVAKKPSPKVKVVPSDEVSPVAGMEASGSESVLEPYVKEEAAEEDAVLLSEVQEKEAPRSEVKLEESVERPGGEAAMGNVQDSADPAASEVEEPVTNQDVPAEDKEVDDEGNEMDVEEGVKESGHENPVEVDDNTTGDGVDGTCNVEGDDKLSDGDNSGSDDDESNKENEGEFPSLYMQPPLTERKKEKEFEIFVGRLDKDAVEDDLVKVFGVFGEIESVRIIKHPSTQKSKGFGFIRYTSIDHAKKALAELKEGVVEVRGKQARVSASQDNDTLYVGNICKTWTREHVIETLEGFGLKQMEDIFLPADPKKEGNIRGFAFLEFSSHSDAMAAFQRLRQPDAVFGCDRSAKVAFATSLHPTDETLLQVRTVYVEGITASWDEEKLKEICKQYGEIEKVQLSRNFTKAKRKDFGFVEFTSHESAVACLEGINNAQFGEGETKVTANLAKPQNKGRLSKQGARGGFKVKKEGEVTEEAGQSKKKKNAKSKEVPDKGKTQTKLKNTKGSQPSNSESKIQPSKSQGKATEVKNGSQAGQRRKGLKRGGRDVDAVANEQPSKKARKNSNYGKMHGRPSNGSGNRRSTYSRMPTVNYATHQTSYASTYAPSMTSYHTHAYAGTSGSSRHHADMQPHAGYIPPAKQVQNTYANDQRRAVAYANQPSTGSGYGRAAIQPSYPGYPSYAGYEAGYAYPISGSYAPRGPYY